MSSSIDIFSGFGSNPPKDRFYKCKSMEHGTICLPIAEYSAVIKMDHVVSVPAKIPVAFDQLLLSWKLGEHVTTLPTNWGK